MAANEDAITNLGLLRKRKRSRKIQKDPETDYEKLYSKLVQRHERVRNEVFPGTANAERGSDSWFIGKKCEVEELNSDGQEIADLVKTKEKVIEDLKKSLVEAKTRISVTQGRYVVSRLLMQQQ